MKILLISDKKEHVYELQKSLTELGHSCEIRKEDCPENILASFEKEEFDSLLLDWNFLQDKALNICELLKHSQLQRYIYCILFPVNHSIIKELEQRQTDVDGYWILPMETITLQVHLSMAQKVLNFDKKSRQALDDLKASKRRLESYNHLLIQASRRFEDLFDGIPVPCFTTDKQGLVYEWNRACESLYGISGNEAISKVIWDLICDEDGTEIFKKSLQKVFQGDPVKPYERIDSHINGTKKNVLSQMIPLKNSSEEVIGAIVANVDMTERKEMEQKLVEEMLRTRNYSLQLEQQRKELKHMNEVLAKLADTDGLTGLSNHRSFQQKLEQLYQELEGEQPISLILMDIDYFKQFNDTFGHPAGDDILRQFSEILRISSESFYFIARYGGEEFAIILPHTSVNDSMEIAEKIRSAVETYPWHLRPVTTSLGVATTTDRSITASKLISLADQALYYSKHSGRNQANHIENVIDTAA